MHDDDKLKLARECARGAGNVEFKHAVQSALAAINALDPQLVDAVGLLREVYDAPHCQPGYVRSETLMRISFFLAKQGEG